MVVGGFPRLLKILTPLVAMLLVVVAAEQAPHTVHHVFEPEAEAQPECLLAVSAERTPAAAAEVVVVLPVEAADLAVRLAESQAAPSPALSPFPPRGPPFSAV